MSTTVAFLLVLQQLEGASGPSFYNELVFSKLLPRDSMWVGLAVGVAEGSLPLSMPPLPLLRWCIEITLSP